MSHARVASYPGTVMAVCRPDYETTPLTPPPLRDLVRRCFDYAGCRILGARLDEASTTPAKPT
jgi:hypothetical protein